MSLASLSQYNEAVSFENPHRSVSREQQEFTVELTKPFQKENFWCLLKKIFAIDKCLSSLPGTPPYSSGSQKYMQQLYENIVLNSLVESCPITDRTTVVPSPAFTSPVNFDPSTQLNLNNFLMFLLCACIPIGSSVSPPTKLMVCLPCPAPVNPAESYGSHNRCEIFPFGVPRKLDDCGSQASRKGKYLPPPAKRHCSTNCLHVCDLKPVQPCKADKGCPCVAHCFESHPKCAVAVSYLILKFFKILKEKMQEAKNRESNK